MIRLSLLASAILINGIIGVSAALAGSSACSAIDVANKKQAQTPFHSVTTENGQQAQSIMIGGARYFQRSGTWLKRPYDPSRIRLAADTPTATCSAGGHDTINGESTLVFTLHNATAAAVADMKYWISASRGLPLQTETTLTIAQRKQQIEVKYDYDNIRAPM